MSRRLSILQWWLLKQWFKFFKLRKALYPPAFILKKKHCVDEFPWLRISGAEVYSFHSRKKLPWVPEVIFLIPDSSRQTVTTRGKTPREKKKITSYQRNYESHFQAILGSYISGNRFEADVHVCFHWLWQLKFDCTWLCSLLTFVAWRFWLGVQCSHKGGRGQWNCKEIGAGATRNHVPGLRPFWVVRVSTHGSTACVAWRFCRGHNSVAKPREKWKTLVALAPQSSLFHCPRLPL